MTAPGHLIINVLVFGRGDRPAMALPAAIGAVLPDLPQIVFYLWAKIYRGLPEMVIWSDAYFQPAWQAVFHLFHSFPLALLGLFGGLLARSRWAAVLFASLMLHGVGDFLLHHDDAHRHFFPLSDWQFHSPVSYWDPAHFGEIVVVLEGIVVLGGSIYLLVTATSRFVRGVAVFALALSMLGWGFAFVMWMT